MENLTELKNLVSQGFPVFPVNPKSKQPLTTNGFKDASKDLGVIENWIESFPNCGWGIPTGETSGLVVIDLDTKHDGPERWKDLVSQNGNEDPKTVTVRSQSGGIHKYYRMNGHELASGSNLAKENSKDKTGIDIRANGGYIVSAVTDGYEWINDFDTPLADIPSWIVAMARKPKPVARDGEKAFSIGRIDTMVPEGERNNYLYGKARDMIRTGTPGAGVIAALMAIRDTQLDPGNHPVTDSEIETIYQSALGVTEVALKPAIPIEDDDGLIPVNAPDEQQCTDMGNSHRFVREYGHRVKFCPAFGWLEYSNGVWESGAGPEVKKLAQESARRLWSKAEDMAFNRSGDFNLWGTWAIRSQSEARINSALNLAKPWLSEKAESFDSHKDLINLKNGVLNLKTKEFEEHSPDFLFTQKANMAYDPEAECPKWEAALDLTFQGNEELIQYAQAGFGWSIGGRTDIKAMFFLYGPSGDNGKSTIVETMLKLMGSYGHKTNINALMENRSRTLSPEKAQFQGKRFVVASEIKAGSRLDTSLIKDLTGNDTITAEKKYLDPFTFDPTHKLWVYGNDKPEVDDDGDAIWNRIKGIPFNYKIPKAQQVPMDKLLEAFEEEAPGILNWLLAGYDLAVNEQHLQKAEPKPVTQFGEEYRWESDPVGQFLSEECTIVEGVSTEKNVLRAAYNRWARLAGYEEISPKKLTQSLKKKGIFIGGAQRRYYDGVTVKE